MKNADALSYCTCIHFLGVQWGTTGISKSMAKNQQSVKLCNAKFVKW